MLLDAGTTSAGGTAGSGLFDVRVPALRTASTQVATDAAHVASAVSDAAGGSDAAAGACGGPLLAAALGRLSAALRTEGGALHDAVSAAATRLSSNADTYDSADADASSGTSPLFTALTSGPTFPAAGR